MFEHSDDYDFTPSASSNLASLFGTTVIPQEEANAALTYTAPKQPNPNRDLKKDVSKVEGSPKTKPQSTIICAKVITLYKPENGQWNLQGRFGLALVTIPPQDTHELIIYKEKNNILVRVNITENFNFTNQNDIYSSFFDNSNQSWLIKFETSDDRNLVSEDIKRLGGNVTTNVNKTTTPQNKTKASNGSISENNKSQDDIDKVPQHSDSSRIRHEELDSDASTGSQIRADILSRMAKMGQSILPGAFYKPQPVDLSDSDTTDTKHPPKPHRKPKKLSMPKEKEIDTPSSSSMTLVNYPTNLHLSSPGKPDRVLVNQPIPTFSSDAYLLENKVRDTEIKLNLCEISTKLDYLIKSVNPVNHSLNTPSNMNDDSSILKAKIKALELHSENLKSEIEKYENKYSQLLREHEKVKDETKQDTAERKEHNCECNEEICKLQEELSKTKLELLESNKLNEETVEKYKEKIEQFEQLTEKQETKIKELEASHVDDKANSDSAESIEELKSVIAALEAKISTMEEYYNKNEEEKQKLKSELGTKQNKFSEDLKQTMNMTFDNIMNSFADKSEYSPSEIEAVIAQNIKKTTFRIIKHFEELN